MVISKSLKNIMSPRFIRYSVVGFIALLVNFLLVALMKSLFQIDYLMACSIAFLIETGIAFAIHRKWTFGIQTSFRKGYMRSVMVGIWSLGIILICTYAGMHFLALHYVWARTASALIAGILTYGIELRLVFATV